jgi:hypothetical protein
MQLQPENNDHRKKDFIDYFFYALAGSAFAAISYSFLLWLQF